MREPSVENKYHLTVSRIRALRVKDRSRLGEAGLRREGACWWIYECAGERDDYLYDTYDTFRLSVYDDDAPEHGGEVQFAFWTYAGISKYEFENFFEPETCGSVAHLEIQEKFLKLVNRLIDMGALEPGKATVQSDERPADRRPDPIEVTEEEIS